MRNRLGMVLMLSACAGMACGARPPHTNTKIFYRSFDSTSIMDLDAAAAAGVLREKNHSSDAFRYR